MKRREMGFERTQGIGSVLAAGAVLVLLVAGCIEAPGAAPGSAEGPWSVSPTEETRPLFTEKFPPAEFADRRERVYDAIGPRAFAILQGAPSPMGFVAFRQSNEFFYLTGIESPHAYVVLDGSSREATLFLRPRDERREFGEGKALSPEDADLIGELAGVHRVRPFDELPEYLAGLRGRFEAVYTPLQPAELRATTRGMANRTLRDKHEDPMDDRPPRHERFIELLEARVPALEVRDLIPILDQLRLIKSPREMELIRASTRLHGLGIIEAMRATRPGVTEYELEAVARYVYWQHGAQGSAYYALAHIGPNAYMNHYHAGVRAAEDGDMILLDYGADYHYYVSDMGRMWPANGRFNDVQRELYGFYLAFYEAILHRIRAGVTAQQILQEALEEIDEILETWEFSRDSYREAAESFVEPYRERAQNADARLGHWVGMAAHDPGQHTGPLVPGLVFVIEPQFRVPEERIYIRLEDTIAITEDGVEIFSDFVPRDIASIERLMRQDGLLDDYPRLMDPEGEFLPPAERIFGAFGR
jgi:Xaa-Pro aminopeptidase